jgi:hypothetical protein
MTMRLLLPTAAITLLAACSTTPPDEEGPHQTSGEVGFSAGLGSAQSMSTTSTSGAVRTAATFVLAHYEATERQKLVALRNARRALAVIKAQPKKRAAMRKKEIRYLAVKTERDRRAQGETSVMLFDTHSEQIVGNEVYDVAVTPPLGASAPFETYAATYVGTGS